MRKYLLWIPTATLIGFSFLISGPVLAGDDIRDPQQMKAIAASEGLISLEEAKQKALAAKPGTIVEAELDRRKWPAGWDYEFEIIDANGVEWEIDIDAKTGEVRKLKID